MKKIVFAVCVAVLLMGSTMSMAPVIEDEIPETCWEWADSAATVHGFWYELSHEEEFAAFEAFYNYCINQ